MCTIGYRASAPGIKTNADRFPAVNDTLNLISSDESLLPAQGFKPGVCLSYRAGILRFQICLLRKQITDSLSLGKYGVFATNVIGATEASILSPNDSPPQMFSLKVQNKYRYNNDTWQITSVVDGFIVKATKLTGDGPKRIEIVARDQSSSYDILCRVQDFYRSDSSSSESETEEVEMAHPI